MPVRREIQEHIQNLDDASLRYLVFMEASHYVPEAVEIACDELARRRIPRLTPEAYWRQYPEEWMDRYRVIRGKKGTFIGRRLKDQDPASEAVQP